LQFFKNAKVEMAKIIIHAERPTYHKSGARALAVFSNYQIVSIPKFSASQNKFILVP
jgi:hypothetical protein